MSAPVTPRQTPKMRGKKRGKGGTEKQNVSGPKPLKSKWPIYGTSFIVGKQSLDLMLCSLYSLDHKIRFDQKFFVESNGYRTNLRFGIQLVGPCTNRMSRYPSLSFSPLAVSSDLSLHC